MLKKSFIISFSFLTILITAFFINIFSVSKKDPNFINNIKQRGSFEKSESASLQGIGVREDLYIADNEIRKHFVIFSESSSVFLNKNFQKYELTKNLEKITFSNEEILNKNITHLRHITAENGIYLFPYELILNNINISFTYLSDLHSLDFQNQYFSGKAKKLYFSADKKKPFMEVDNFEGNFSPTKGLKCRK